MEIKTNDLFTKIQMKQCTFTKAEQKVADFVLKDPKKVLYMSITELADACKVGDTSVFRFCRSLRLSGYQSFKMCLAQAVQMKGTSSHDNYTGEITKNDPISSIADKVLNTSIASLRESRELISLSELEQSVAALKQAQRIAFFGAGSSQITAMEATERFLRITDKAFCMWDNHMQAMMASLLSPKSVAVIISYSGSTKDCVDLARLCKANGVKVICITRFEKSPLASVSDIILLSGGNEGPLQGGSISAKMSQLYVMDILYEEYFKQTHLTSIKNRKKTTASVADKLY